MRVSIADVTCPNTVDTNYIQDGSTSVISGVNAAYATYFTAFEASGSYAMNTMTITAGRILATQKMCASRRNGTEMFDLGW